MAKPTVASLQADLKAALSALNTYVAQLNTLHKRVEHLEAQLKDTQQAVVETATQIIERAPARARANTTLVGIDAATRKAACAKFFELNPQCRSVTDSELRQFGFIQ